MIFLQQFVDGRVRRAGSPDFTRTLQGYRTVLVDRIPLVTDFQILSCTVVSKALYTRIPDGMMRHWERNEKVFNPRSSASSLRTRRIQASRGQLYWDWLRIGWCSRENCSAAHRSAAMVAHLSENAIPPLNLVQTPGRDP